MYIVKMNDKRAINRKRTFKPNSSIMAELFGWLQLMQRLWRWLEKDEFVLPVQDTDATIDHHYQYNPPPTQFTPLRIIMMIVHHISIVMSVCFREYPFECVFVNVLLSVFSWMSFAVNDYPHRYPSLLWITFIIRIHSSTDSFIHLLHHSHSHIIIIIIIIIIICHFLFPLFFSFNSIRILWE